MTCFMGMRLNLIIGIFCLMLVSQGIALGQTNRISGHVFGNNRRPVPEVYVELLNEINTVVFRVKTDGGGVYFFIGMAAGRYNVHVRPFGTDYEEETQEVEIVPAMGSGKASDNQQKDFFLRPRKDVNKQLGVTGVIFAQEIPEEAKKAFDRALVEIEANRSDNGILELENAAKIFPDYYYALDRLGSELLKKQKYVEAGKAFERAVVVNPRSSNSLYGLAYVLYSQDLTTESIDMAKKAVTIAPESADINIMLGIALRKGKQFSDAEKALLKAKKLTKGKSADASWNLALLYAYNLKNNRLAADELENYLKINPNHPDVEKLRKLIAQYRLGK